jgi:hypothetical protein
MADYDISCMVPTGNASKTATATAVTGASLMTTDNANAYLVTINKLTGAATDLVAMTLDGTTPTGGAIASVVGLVIPEGVYLWRSEFLANVKLDAGEIQIKVTAQGMSF